MNMKKTLLTSLIVLCFSMPFAMDSEGSVDQYSEEKFSVETIKVTTDIEFLSKAVHVIGYGDSRKLRSRNASESWSASY